MMLESADRGLEPPRLDGLRFLYVSEYDLASAVSSRLRIEGVSASLRIAGAEVNIVGARELAPLSLKGQSTWRTSRGARVLLGVPGLHEAIVRHAPHVVILYGTHLGMLREASRAAREAGASLAVDIVEWFDPSGMPLGPLGPYRLTHEYAMSRIGRYASMGVAVSTLLLRHLEAQGVRAIRVPPLFSRHLKPVVEAPRPGDGRVHFCFAGSVGTKDWNSLQNLILATRHVDPDGQAVVVHVVGEIPAGIVNLLDSRETDMGRVILHGRSPHDLAVRILLGCDYAVVQRRTSLRNVQAGFPSKVAESLTLGVPVVTNLFSDLGDYLTDGQNAVLLSGEGFEAMHQGIRTAVERRGSWKREEIADHAHVMFGPAQYAAALANLFAASP